MATIVHFDIGDVWKPQATFTVAAVNTDPTTLVVKVRDPSGNVATTTESSPATLTSVSSPVARTTAGTYILYQSLDEAGHWYCRFEGTGAAVGAEDFEAVVDPTPFYADGGLAAYALVTLGETKDWLAERHVDTSDDLQIVAAINAACRRIMEVSGREFKSRTTVSLEERSFEIGWSDGYGVMYIGDMATETSSSATITDLHTGTLIQTLTTADYVALPRNRPTGEPITSLRFLASATGFRTGRVLNITAQWGWPSVPEDVKHAVKDTVAFWLDRDTEHFRQDLGAVPGGSEGGQTVIIGSSPTILPLPPEAFTIAKDHRLMVFA